MAISKQKKVEIVADFAEKVKDAQSIVFVNFRKLPVSETISLRRALRAEGVGYSVVKKTLAKRVLGTLGVSGDMPVLDGEVAFAYSADMLAPARSVYEFQKTHKEQVAIVGGVFEGKYMSKELMMGIATIPPREVLYAQFVNLINSPIQRFAVVLDQIAASKEASA